MKKSLFILSALLLCAAMLVGILVKGSDPDRVLVHTSRNYKHFKLKPSAIADFPGRVSIMRAWHGKVYGYVYNDRTIYCYHNDTRVLDTFFNNRTYPISMITRMEIEDSTGTFYLFADGDKKIITYKPGTHTIDSITYMPVLQPADNNISLALMIRVFDSVQKRSCLRWVQPAASKVSTLYAFSPFKDGGLSADGFFLQHGASHFYVPFYNSRIVQYDAQHDKVSTITTIDKTQPSNIAMPAGNAYSLSSKAIFINSTAAADENHLYILSYVLSADALATGYRGPAVDVYSTTDGHYEGSIRLPGYKDYPVLQMDKDGETLVAAYNNTLLLFKLNAS